MKVVVVLRSQGGTQITLDDPQLPGGLARLAARSWRKRSSRWASSGGTRPQRLIRRLRKPAEAILGLRWIERASLYFDLTDQALGGLVRRAGVSRSKNNPIKRPRMPQIEPQWKRSKMAMKRSRTPAGLTWCVCNGSPDQVVKFPTWVQLVTLGGFRRDASKPPAPSFARTSSGADGRCPSCGR
jgi:hypothetical protein